MKGLKQMIQDIKPHIFHNEFKNLKPDANDKAIVFDGKNKQVLRKYSLRLKNTLKQMNAGKDMEDWVKDENDNVITVEVAG